MSSNDRLQRKGFLANFTEPEVETLMSIATKSSWREGETLFRARAAATHLYILRTGTILLVYPNGRSFPVRNGYQAIGWSTLVSPYHYTATGLCLTDVALFQLSRGDLFDLLRMDAGLGHRLMNEIARLMHERKPYRSRK